MDSHCPSLISTFSSWIDHSHDGSDELLKLFPDILSKDFSITAMNHAPQRKKIICWFCKKSGHKSSSCRYKKRKQRHHFQRQPVKPIPHVLDDQDGLLHSSRNGNVTCEITSLSMKRTLRLITSMPRSKQLREDELYGVTPVEAFVCTSSVTDNHDDIIGSLQPESIFKMASTLFHPLYSLLSYLKLDVGTLHNESEIGEKPQACVHFGLPFSNVFPVSTISTHFTTQFCFALFSSISLVVYLITSTLCLAFFKFCATMFSLIRYSSNVFALCLISSVKHVASMIFRLMYCLVSLMKCLLSLLLGTVSLFWALIKLILFAISNPSFRKSTFLIALLMLSSMLAEYLESHSYQLSVQSVMLVIMLIMDLIFNRFA